MVSSCLSQKRGVRLPPSSVKIHSARLHPNAWCLLCSCVQVVCKWEFVSMWAKCLMVCTWTRPSCGIDVNYQWPKVKPWYVLWVLLHNVSRALHKCADHATKPFPRLVTKVRNISSIVNVQRFFQWKVCTNLNYPKYKWNIVLVWFKLWLTKRESGSLEFKVKPAVPV